jgi:SAM-dependent methyltransferase
MAGAFDDAVKVIQQANRSPRTVTRLCLAQAIDMIVIHTRETYEEEARAYEKVRGSEISLEDTRLNRLLLDSVRARLALGLIDSTDPAAWRLLDVGAGYGRDAKFFGMQTDVRVSVIDNCSSFIKILRDRASSGDLILDRVTYADMRNLSTIATGSYECVRNHATLHHLPLAPYGLGADAAVSETRRILVRGGVFHCFVKGGSGIAVTDTEEGLGRRFYQFFTEQSLRELLKRHELEPFHCETIVESRPAGDVGWLLMLGYAR